jgi:hypothetical protein
VGKEYTLCRVTTIRIAVFTVKDVSRVGQVSITVSVFGGITKNLNMSFCHHKYYHDVIDAMIIIMD